MAVELAELLTVPLEVGDLLASSQHLHSEELAGPSLKYSLELP